jgi:hypothetical protein
MATLSVRDLTKRCNWDVFLNRVLTGMEFRLLDKDGETVKIRPCDHLISALKNRNFANTPFINNNGSIFLPTITNTTVSLTKLFKDKEFGGIETGKQQAERQEQSLITEITKGIKKNKGKSITLRTSRKCLKKVTSIKKADYSHYAGKEPYVDLVIQSGKKKINISAKGLDAHSIAGGGISGLMSMPDVNKEIVYAVHTAHDIFDRYYRHIDGKPVNSRCMPELYYRIPNEHILTILKGTPAMGGMVDYMYVGPMQVTSSYHFGELTVDGCLISIEKYAKSVENLFLRIRRRTSLHVLDLKAYDKEGLPGIFSYPGEGYRRITVVTESRLPKSVKVVTDRMYITNHDKL